MAYEQRDNSGSLFVNDRKEKENHPDSKGSAMIDGREYWVSAWRKAGKSGQKFLSLAFKAKDDQTSDPKAETGVLAGATEVPEADIPF
jgi:hypothetical protein